MARTYYGAYISGCSGRELIICERRSTADRIRRACRTHAASGGWTGAATLRALADLAAAHPGMDTSSILVLFRSRH